MIDHVFAEEALIDSLYSGSCDPCEAGVVYAKLSPESFSDPRLGVMFGAASELFAKAPELVDQVAAYSLLVERGRLAAAGGATRIAEVTSGSGTGANVLHWARTVAEQHRRRRIAEAAGNARACAEDPAASVIAGSAVLAEALDEAAVDVFASEELTAADLSRLEFMALERRAKEETNDEYIPTGYYDLDAITGGFTRGEMTILAGRPGMGKTAFALCLARNVAATHNVLFFSLEMSASALFSRLVTMSSGISARELRHAKHVVETQPAKVMKAFSEAHNDKLTIVESPRSTVHDIRAKVRNAVSRGKAGLVVVDYLQRVRPAEKAHSREREVAEISDELSAIAKEFRVPVLCLAQLNRAVEQRDDKLPTLGNLRESGSIEQDADVVLFVHREGYYDRNGKDADKAQICIAKNRNGDGGVANLRWIGNRMLFVNAAREQ